MKGEERVVEPGGSRSGEEIGGGTREHGYGVVRWEGGRRGGQLVGSGSRVGLGPWSRWGAGDGDLFVKKFLGRGTDILYSKPASVRLLLKMERKNIFLIIEFLFTMPRGENLDSLHCPKTQFLSWSYCYREQML